MEIQKQQMVVFASTAKEKTRNVGLLPNINLVKYF